MTPFEIRRRQPVDEDEAAHPSEVACRAGQELEDEERRIVDRAGDIGEHHQI